jgi:hypothetical protein
LPWTWAVRAVAVDVGGPSRCRGRGRSPARCTLPVFLIRGRRGPLIGSAREATPTPSTRSVRRSRRATPVRHIVKTGVVLLVERARPRSSRTIGGRSPRRADPRTAGQSSPIPASARGSAFAVAGYRRAVHPGWSTTCRAAATRLARCWSRSTSPASSRAPEMETRPLGFSSRRRGGTGRAAQLAEKREDPRARRLRERVVRCAG